MKEVLQNSNEFKEIPQTAFVREQIWSETLNLIKGVSRRKPMNRGELVTAGRCLLENFDLEERYLGYMMVMINNAFWLEQFMSVSIENRLLLLPRCLTNLRDVRGRAEELGYKIYVAEGSPVVVKIIAEEEMNAILGVGCLDSLEKAFDKVRQVGIPSIAIPLTTNGCRATEVDTKFVFRFLEGSGPKVAERTRTYLPLLRIAHRMFSGAEFKLLLSDFPDGESETARIAHQWLLRGGKRLRPFVTLASFKAFAPDENIPLGVKRIALAIEAFHKASLVHDDIEDDDEFRYDEKTIHRKYGVPVAINVGDYLVGLGYRLAATVADEFGANIAFELSRVFSDAHIKLTQGQGSELFWRRNPSPQLNLAEALHSYMLKTSPAFEAALVSGMVMAGVNERYSEIARLFSKHLGVAFQIENDLKGWTADALRVHPTALLALALEKCTEAEKAKLLHPTSLSSIEEIYLRCNVFDRAQHLIERLRGHATEVAEVEALACVESHGDEVALEAHGETEVSPVYSIANGKASAPHEVLEAHGDAVTRLAEGRACAPHEKVRLLRWFRYGFAYSTRRLATEPVRSTVRSIAWRVHSHLCESHALRQRAPSPEKLGELLHFLVETILE